MLTLLDPADPASFPPVDQALTEPDGLLAVGGDLSSNRLLNAYRHGIFPWYNHGEPILWWSPDPRLVLFPERLKVSRSLRKTLKKKDYTVTLDRAFSHVVDACAAPRKREKGTWIIPEMKYAYIRLYQQGYAHSVESWYQEQLVGGLYGVAIGKVFYGESMFHRRTDASKVAFVTLVKLLQSWGYGLIDCQVRTNHLVSLGAEEIPRRRFVRLLDDLCPTPCAETAWRN
ncbi:leucyl/phenylalanyl-tRNA--protein transferase [Methylohalobius crimeensis]|uniref:leucyl/phenylalanyl-tRNA--protein transferase n=1 Tax=Methylohalobius crimeensis TaxID=244365 RepID=UPI0003B576EC|nr:leucyl/phenylalanyl-tRNA--protein transferase [Methylohalobius crimeensis]